MFADSRTAIHTVDAPPASGPFSQAIRVGDYAFLSGQGPFDVAGECRRGSIAEQTALALENLAAVSEAAGGSLRHAVRMGIYMRDLAGWHEMNAVYERFFDPPYPARTTIQSDLQGFDIEIDAIVYVGNAE